MCISEIKALLNFFSTVFQNPADAVASKIIASIIKS